MRMKKGRWLHRLAVALGTAAATVMLTQVPAAARDLICTEGTTCQVNATETVTRENDFYCGPIMPGDTVKMEGRKNVSQTSGEPEHITQVVSMDVEKYFYYTKESMKTGPYTASYISGLPTDGYKAGIENDRLNNVLQGLEFVTGKVYNQQGSSIEVITGFKNNTDKVIQIYGNGQGPAYLPDGQSTSGLLDEKDNLTGQTIRTYNFRRESMYLKIFDPECDITYDLDGGTLQGKNNPSTYTVATLEPRTVKIWAPVKEGNHCAAIGSYNGGHSLFGEKAVKGQENGQTYYVFEYWPGYFALFADDNNSQNRDFWFSFNKGYTAVFHGNGGTANGLDIWISEVDRDKDSTWPYKYTDVNFTPVRAGYQFEGWYLDENFSQKFYGFQDDRTYDTTGHADWKIPFWTTRSDYITDLYAKWSGGTEPEPSTAPLPSEAPTPSTAPLPSEAPTPSTAPTPTKAPEQSVTPGNTQTPTPTAAPALPKKGSQHKVKGLIYKVTASTASKKTVTVMRPVKKTEKKITIPAYVKLGSYTYQVTSINAKAFRNNKRLVQVTIGAKITKIGRQAFEGCKNLKKITIRSKAVKKIEVNAFRKVKKGAKIYVPKAKYKAYKKYLKAAKITKDIKVIRK